MLKLGKNKKNKEEAGGKSAPAANPQGITASGNALYRLAGQILLLLLIPLLAGFTYLMTIHEPGLQQQQLDRIATAFATQQATNVHRLQNRLRERMRGAARSPLALSAIASGTEADVDLVEQAMLDYFPEVISLRILPIGEMGTAAFASGSHGLRNHIEVDLVRRASEGVATRPDAFRFEDRWMTSLAELVTHPRMPERRGVIIATIDNQLLSSELASLNKSAGKFSLEQQVNTGAERWDSIASAGNGGAADLTRYARIPDTTWRVAFTPSNELLQSLAIDNLPLISILALCIAACIAGVAMLVSRLPRVLGRELDRVIAAADKKSPLQVEIPELVTIAKHLRRATLRSLRQRSVAPTQAPEVEYTPSGDLTNPMFQSTSMLDEEREEEEVLELDIVEAEGAGAASNLPADFPDHIFRAYDIRGIASTELTDEMVASIGGAIGTLAREQDEQTLIVGCDGRTSSARIKSALIKALVGSGRDVIDIGLVCTPQLYFATRHLDCGSGVMITGSHNPAEYNGLKIVLNQHTIAAGGIEEIRDRALAGKFSRGQGRMIREDITHDYMEEVVGDIAIAVPLKIVIDAGNGATSEIAPALFDELGCEVVPLYCKMDGNFPNHSPDTSNEDNLVDLVRVVQEQGADFGVAFDGDGDRLAVVTGSGRIVRSDLLLMIYAQDVVSRNPGADVVFDVKCSRNLTQLITQYGGRPVLWKTGHAFMKEKMMETGALLGGEFSGHMFFGERWYGFDDGMYAAARLAEILSTYGSTLDEAIADFPASVNTPEILIPIAEDEKFSTMDNIIKGADFPSGKINTLDGLRVDFAEGWGLVRASNTSAALTARFESTTEEGLQAIMQEFRGQLELADPGLELPF